MKDSSLDNKKSVTNIKNNESNKDSKYNKDKKYILFSIKNIYLSVNTPVIFCDEKLRPIWKNTKAKKTLREINLDLILSKDNSEDIKKVIKENKHGMVNASFLPFLGCKIDVMPVKYNSFLGAILIFELVEKDDLVNVFNDTDNIVSILSSNLRLPMHLITNAIEILNYDVEKIDSVEKEKIKKSILVVENNTYKMYRICKNLSELIRFSTNSNVFEKSLVKIADYINNLIDGCSNYIRLSGRNVVYRFMSDSDAPYWMMLDCEKFDLAISNVILNSCQYSHKNTDIKIIVKVLKNRLVITIEDEGFGIAKDKICDVFRPYTTIDNGHYVSKGMGIGLTLAKYIISQHNGTIKLDSEVNVGTTVKISIPIICDIDDKVVKINSVVGFTSKMSTVAIQFSPLLY